MDVLLYGEKGYPTDRSRCDRQHPTTPGGPGQEGGELATQNRGGAEEGQG